MTKHSPYEAAAVRIADEVRAELARQRKTAAQLAAAIGVGQHTIGNRLKGTVPFNVVELLATAAWLGLSVTDLATRAEASQPSSDARWAS